MNIHQNLPESNRYETNNPKLNDNDSIDIDSIDYLVSERIRICRLSLGLRQADLGRALGVSIQQVQKYEKGTNRISSGKLKALSVLFKVPISYFFEEKDTNQLLDQVQADLPEKDLLNIIKVFGEIPHASLKKTIIELVKQINCIINSQYPLSQERGGH